MTHGRHMNEDELILSVIDKNDLAEDVRKHLETCSECQRQATEFETGLSGMGQLAQAYSPHPYRKIRFDSGPKPVFKKPLPALAAAFAIMLAIAGTWWLAPDDGLKTRTTAQLTLEMEQDTLLLEEVAEIVTLAEESYSPAIFTEANGHYSQEFMEFVIPFEDDRNEAMKTGFSRGIHA